MNKKERNEKLIKWLELSEEERRKFNGFNGFLNGTLFKDENLFMKEYKDRLKRKNKIEKERRDKNERSSRAN